MTKLHGGGLSSLSHFFLIISFCLLSLPSPVHPVHTASSSLKRALSEGSTALDYSSKRSSSSSSSTFASDALTCFLCKQDEQSTAILSTSSSSQASAVCTTCLAIAEDCNNPFEFGNRFEGDDDSSSIAADDNNSEGNNYSSSLAAGMRKDDPSYNNDDEMNDDDDAFKIAESDYINKGDEMLDSDDDNSSSEYNDDNSSSDNDDDNSYSAEIKFDNDEDFVDGDGFDADYSIAEDPAVANVRLVMSQVKELVIEITGQELYECQILTDTLKERVMNIMAHADDNLVPDLLKRATLNQILPKAQFAIIEGFCPKDSFTLECGTAFTSKMLHTALEYGKFFGALVCTIIYSNLRRTCKPNGLSGRCKGCAVHTAEELDWARTAVSFILLLLLLLLLLSVKLCIDIL
jgi:hypothetical protein